MKTISTDFLNQDLQMKKNNRVKVVIEIEERILWWLFNEAHRRDITLNQLVEHILKECIETTKKEKNKARRNGTSVQHA